MSLRTSSIVKLMSRLPFRITCDSVSCTKEFPLEILIASYVVARSIPAAADVTSASLSDSRFAVAR